MEREGGVEREGEGGMEREGEEEREGGREREGGGGREGWREEGEPDFLKSECSIQHKRVTLMGGETKASVPRARAPLRLSLCLSILNHDDDGAISNYAEKCSIAHFNTNRTSLQLEYSSLQRCIKTHTEQQTRLLWENKHQSLLRWPVVL